MESSHSIACAIVAFLVARGDRIVTDGGTLSLRANGMGATHLVALLEGADGAVAEYAVSLVVGRIR